MADSQQSNLQHFSRQTLESTFPSIPLKSGVENVCQSWEEVWENGKACGIFGRKFSSRFMFIVGNNQLSSMIMRKSSRGGDSMNSQPQGGRDNQRQCSFENSNYIYPNQVESCRKFKSFVTSLDISGGDLSQYHNKRLTLINRSHYVIKLKQIKKDEQHSSEQLSYYRYLLYYQAIPFSLYFVKINQITLAPQNSKVEKALKDVVADLIDYNIYFEVTLEKCGFTDQGEFRVYVPPVNVLHDRKLTSAEKLKMGAAVANVIKFWQADRASLTNGDRGGASTSRNSYRFGSTIGVPKQINESKNQQGKNHRLSQQNSDIKKTIKLSKNYIKQLNQKEEKSKQKLQELKKHKSMGLIPKQIDNVDSKKASHFIEKIDELNKKISNIRTALITKKSIDHQRENLQAYLSREKGKKNAKNLPFFSPQKNEEDNYLQEVIFEKKDPKNLGECHQQYLEDDRDSVDTYLQEIGSEYKMPKFSAHSELRNTTLPTELLNIKNNLQQGRGKDEKSNWHHESAGNQAFKKFLQKNKEIYPELMYEPKSPTSLSKISAPNKDQYRSSRKFLKESSVSKIKKMASLDNFEVQIETKSINLSQFSNDLSKVKKRRQKQEKSNQIKAKIQDILAKSKKAIDLLKSPNNKQKR